jgi:hypothetical protein
MTPVTSCTVCYRFGIAVTHLPKGGCNRRGQTLHTRKGWNTDNIANGRPLLPPTKRQLDSQPPNPQPSNTTVHVLTPMCVCWRPITPEPDSKTTDGCSTFSRGQTARMPISQHTQPLQQQARAPAVLAHAFQNQKLSELLHCQQHKWRAVVLARLHNSVQQSGVQRSSALPCPEHARAGPTAGVLVVQQYSALQGLKPDRNPGRLAPSHCNQTHRHCMQSGLGHEHPDPHCYRCNMSVYM